MPRARVGASEKPSDGWEDDEGRREVMLGIQVGWQRHAAQW